MGRARELTTVELEPDRAFELWTDVRRWPSFVDGFGHAERVDDAWPAEGAKLVWRSRQGGRGVVSERVVRSERGAAFATQVMEERMTGTQAVSFSATEEGGGAEVRIELDYELSSSGPFRGLVDFFFIRRAQTDSLRRTLRRFATEAAEEATLG